MNRNDVPWRGYFAAAPTPFDADGALNESLLRSVLRAFADDGVHGLLVNGSTGEWFSQMPDERREVARIAVDEVGEHLPVLVGISSLRPAETIELGQHASRIGAAGVVYSPPPAARLTQREVVEFYRQTAAEIACPVMAYNIPADVVTDIAPETIALLAEIDNIVAIKDSTSDDRQYHRTVELVSGKLRVFGNALTPAGLSLMATGVGGDGHFGAGTLLGPRAAQAFELLWVGDVSAAIEIAQEFSRARSLLHGADGNGIAGGAQAQLKAIMNIQGVPAGAPRLPCLPIEDDPEALRLLTTVLADLGLLQSAKHKELA